MREEDAENQLANLLLPRASFLASQTLLGELSPAHLRDLIRFYALTGKIEATHAGLETMSTSLKAASAGSEKDMYEAALAAGLRTLGRLLAESWALGAQARVSLDTMVRESWMAEPPPIDKTTEIIASARARRASHLTVTG